MKLKPEEVQKVFDDFNEVIKKGFEKEKEEATKSNFPIIVAVIITTVIILTFGYVYMRFMKNKTQNKNTKTNNQTEFVNSD